MSSARRYPGVRLCSCLHAARRRPLAWSFAVRQPPCRSALGVTGSLTFLGNPHAFMPGSSTPAGQIVLAKRTTCTAPDLATPKARRDDTLSGLNNRALRLAVYASQPGLLPDHARLASGCRPALPDGIGYPQGSNERFPKCIPYISSSFPKLRDAMPHVASQRQTMPIRASQPPTFRPFWHCLSLSGTHFTHRVHEPPETMK